MSALLDRLLDRAVEQDDCWVWQGAKSGGYGHVRVNSGNARPTHRVVYEILIGPIPDGLELDHLCRNRACLNPWHLDPVPRRINILRGVGASARNARKTACPQGHPYRLNYAGHRICNACRSAEQRRRRARLRLMREDPGLLARLDAAM